MDTFVVRLWETEEQRRAADALRGTVLHVASGRTTPFVGVQELLSFFATESVQRPGSMRRPEDLEALAT